MRSTEWESFAEATCCHQHQRRACIPSATTVKNKQEIQADYHARTKVEWTALKERKQSDSEETLPLKRVVTTDVESSLEDASKGVCSSSKHSSATAGSWGGTWKWMITSPHAQLWEVSENWFCRLHLPVSHLLSIFEGLSGAYDPSLLPSALSFYVFRAFIYVAFSVELVPFSIIAVNKKTSVWMLFFFFKCHWLQMQLSEASKK